MSNLAQQLISITKYRLDTEIAPQNPVKFLHTLDTADCIATSVEVIYMYTRQARNDSVSTALFSEVILNIGKKLRKGLIKDSALESKAGAFLLYSFEAVGLLHVSLGQGTGKHATYIVTIIDEDGLTKLWDKLDFGKSEKLPYLEPLPPWIRSEYQNGTTLVKTRDAAVLESLSPESHPIVFDCVNKAQAIGWRINEPIHQLFAWSIRNKTEAFSEIWAMQSDEARASKLRETHAIGAMAGRLLGKTFYHMHSLDFRGRLYASTAYLTHQGNDISKALLLREDAKPLGVQGFFWLMVSIANYWGGDSHIDGYKTDKIPLQERVNWALDNEELLLSYAVSPKVNDKWHKADSPWQFIAACFELRKFREWQAYMRTSGGRNFDEYGYSSGFTGWLDGSTNGIQHLSALTRDENVAPYANLVPLEYPGDLYLYVAEHVWRTIGETVSKIPAEDLEGYESLIDNVIEIRKEITASESKSDRRKELVDKLHLFRSSYASALKEASPVFWNRITDKKQKRKISKRGVMTISYGSTAYGMGDQVISDARKHSIELLQHMEKTFGVYMGRLIFNDCRISLKRPMELLSLFEKAGERAEEDARFLSWTAPITDFPVVQHYVEGTVKKIWVQYGPPVGERLSTSYYENTYQIAVCFNEHPKHSSRKQKSGASPNIVHSLDAAHLMLVVHRAPFPVTTVHDSFGCLLSDMGQLFKLTRATFVELYSTNPLNSIMREIGGDIRDVDIGTLDINLVLESEYAFS